MQKAPRVSRDGIDGASDARTSDIRKHGRLEERNHRMSRPVVYTPSSPELLAAHKSAYDAVLEGRFDQEFYERTIRSAEAAGATLSDIQSIELHAIRFKLVRVLSLHT